MWIELLVNMLTVVISYNGTTAELGATVQQNSVIAAKPSVIKEHSVVTGEQVVENIILANDKKSMARGKDVSFALSNVTKTSAKNVDSTIKPTVLPLPAKKGNAARKEIDRSLLSTGLTQGQPTAAVDMTVTNEKLKAAVGSSVEQEIKLSRNDDGKQAISGTNDSGGGKLLSDTNNKSNEKADEEKFENKIDLKHLENINSRVSDDANERNKNQKTEKSDGNDDEESVIEQNLNTGDIKNVENYHMLYYVLVVIISGAFLYVAIHNKKKILGKCMLIEGRKPVGTRRSTVRYRRLSQREDTDSYGYRDSESVIY
uniref:Trans-golgi network integral membrane protein tgn38 n=1 Tax=Syphacia muris TaxID=451379 RepID=A0A0N5AWL8_9BILA